MKSNILLIFIILKFSHNFLLRGDSNNRANNITTVPNLLNVKKEVSKDSTIKKETQPENKHQYINAKQINHSPAVNTPNSKESNYESVQIIKRDKLLDAKTPEYVKPETKNQMQTATLTGSTKKVEGLTERPNFLSSVIISHPTSVSTPIHLHQPNDSTTYDLDSIRDNVKEIYPTNNLPNIQNIPNVQKNIIQINDFPNLNNQLDAISNINYPVGSYTTKSNPKEGIQNINHLNSLNNPLAPASDLPVPVSINTLNNSPIRITNPLANNNLHFNMKVNYPNTVFQPTIHQPDFFVLENNLNHLDKLNDRDINELLTKMKQMEESLGNQNEEIYQSIKKYDNQNGVILESLKDEEEDANKKLGGMIVEADQNQREEINKEIEDEFSRSLAGYNINKNRYPHLKDLDPNELIDVSTKIKNDLNNNNNFFLHGDYSFYK